MKEGIVLGSTIIRRDREGSFYAVDGNNTGDAERDGVTTGALLYRGRLPSGLDDS